MTRSGAFIVRPADHQTPLNVVGVKVTVLASNSVTRACEITLQKGEAGMGPPPHRHAWDESFYVLNGSVEFNCDGVTEICPAGTLVHVPANTLHAFQFVDGGGEMLEFTGSGGNATRMFGAVHEAIPPGPLDLPKVIEVLARNGVEVAL
ncbi:MAG: cupin domain-containing protein [Sedimenticola sp.]|nr:cupin domain-containing protein [Sedimenticola sp.]